MAVCMSSLDPTVAITSVPQASTSGLLHLSHPCRCTLGHIHMFSEVVEAANADLQIDPLVNLTIFRGPHK
jgi:hypothetical protein